MTGAGVPKDANSQVATEARPVDQDQSTPSLKSLFLSLLDQKQQTEMKLENERGRTLALATAVAKLVHDLNELIIDVLVT